MIQYHRSAFGLNLLLRAHGSAVYRGSVMGFLSMIFLIIVRKTWEGPHHRTPDELDHPYAVGVLVATLTFLLVFRAQSAYGRYWEACGGVYHMMSKWMDATTHTAVYHMQCDHYNHVKPPVFYDYPHLNQHYLTRDRERRNVLPEMEFDRIGGRAEQKSIETVKRTIPTKNVKKRRRMGRKTTSGSNSQRGDPEPLEGDPKLDGGWSAWFDDGRTTYIDPKNPDAKDPKGFASIQGGRTPALFLQELAHLCSLTMAVALSTLRNDVEGAQSPLDIFVPGSDFPAVDVSKMDGLAFESTWTEDVLLFLGMGRSPEQRTRYNASRPLKVIGGVSDAEIRMLQMAKGPYAKTQLCWQWLSEFIIREHLAGSLGKVGPPIISRIIQFLGDGMIYYNQSRKIMFIPFPFPHSQLSAIYVLVAVPTIAFLMDQYTDNLWVGCILTFLTVTALSGIHEVARELENPFRNVPNEIPLATLMAEANEALLTMYAGYHPDLFWGESAKQYAPYGDTPDEKPSMNGFGDKGAGWKGVGCKAMNRGTELEDKVNMLMKKIEEQGRELDLLRLKMKDEEKPNPGKDGEL